MTTGLLLMVLLVAGGTASSLLPLQPTARESASSDLATSASPSEARVPSNDAVADRPVLRALPPKVYLRLEAGMGAGPGKSFTYAAEHGGTFLGFVRLNAAAWRGVSLAALVELNIWPQMPLALGPGYEWHRWDIGLAPRYTIRPFKYRGRPVGFEAYLAVPLGMTSVSVTPPPRRAFREEIQQTGGWFAGVAAGAAYSGRSRILGVFVELAYARHSIDMTSTVTPIEAPQSSTAARFTDSDHRITFSIGGTLALARSEANVVPDPP